VTEEQFPPLCPKTQEMKPVSLYKTSTSEKDKNDKCHCSYNIFLDVKLVREVNARVEDLVEDCGWGNHIPRTHIEDLAAYLFHK